MSDIHDIEKTSLEAHVSLCQERYVGLQHRIGVLETKLTNLEAVMREIRDEIRELGDKSNKKWDATQVSIISGLAGLVLFLVGKLFF